MRPGLVPTILGTAVTGYALTKSVPDMRKRGFRKKKMDSLVTNGLLGFGLAHMVLGGIDLFRD